MTNRTLSKTIPQAWNMNPMNTKAISPYEAIIIPITMIDTFPNTFKFGGSICIAHVVKTRTTGVVACFISHVAHNVP
jgi:hypothetical protein